MIANGLVLIVRGFGQSCIDSCKGTWGIYEGKIKQALKSLRKT
jgi:hypothetical protein